MSKRNKIVEEHWRKHYSRLVKVVTRRVPNQSQAVAEEVVQEAYTNAIKYYRTYDPEKGEFQTWFEKVLRNAVNKCKSDESGISHRELEDDDQPTSPTRGEKELLPLILENIVTVTNTYEKEILLLFYFNGYKSIEIAEFLNKKHSTIRQVIYKWRARIGLDEEQFVNT